MGKRRTPANSGIAAEVAGRRAVLAGLGVVGAGTLAACSSGGSSASSTPSASTATQAAAPSSAAPTASAPTSAAAPVTPAAPVSSAAPASSTAAPAATTAPAPAGFSVAETEIPVGTGKYFAAAAVIITQPTAGSFRAFTSVCTHQGCPVTQSSGALMICPCHGSEYSIKDGSVVMGPATKPLAAKKFTVAGGKVIVAKT